MLLLLPAGPFHHPAAMNSSLCLSEIPLASLELAGGLFLCRACVGKRRQGHKGREVAHCEGEPGKQWGSSMEEQSYDALLPGLKLTNNIIWVVSTEGRKEGVGGRKTFYAPPPLLCWFSRHNSWQVPHQHWSVKNPIWILQLAFSGWPLRTVLFCLSTPEDWLTL